MAAAHGDDDDARTLVSIGGLSENAIERAAERENATPPPTPTRGNVRTRSRSRLERDPPPPPPSPDMRDTTTPEREDEEINNTDTSGDPDTGNTLTPTEQLTNQTRTVYRFVGSVYLLHLVFCVLAKSGVLAHWRMLIEFRCVAFYNALYWFVRAFYCEFVQNWLRSNTQSRFLRKMFANGATFYGETVGTPTKWSQALAIFFLNAASCNGMRVFVLAVFVPGEHMPGLGGVCLIQALFHMGLIRMHSMLNAVHTVANFITQTILHPTAAHHATLLVSVIPAMLMNNLLCGLIWDSSKVHWNLVVKILADGFWYTLRLFIVRDPLLALVGKPSDNNLEQYVLQHLMEAMLDDFVLTMFVAFFCGGNETVIFWWTSVDFFVQFLSFFVLAVVAFKAEKLGIQALKLDSDWEKKKRNCVDTCLKFLIMAAHLAYLPLNWAAYTVGVGAVIAMIPIIML